MHPILQQLATLPDGIAVSHSTNSVKARLGDGSGNKHTWLYRTNIAAQSGPIFIERTPKKMLPTTSPSRETRHERALKRNTLIFIISALIASSYKPGRQAGACRT
jgi:hypothetical protein